MAELKTQPNDASVNEFIQAVEGDDRRNDCLSLLSMMKRVTKKEPMMWGDSIVGFGRYHYKNRSGREGNWFVTGFAPRKRELTIYIMPGFEQYSEFMEKLGKHKTGKSCLYIKRLADIDAHVLEILITQSIVDMKEMYECR